MLTKKKKVIVLVSMLVLLVVTGFLNIMLNNSTEDVSTNLNSEYSSSFFTTCRTDRTNTRNESIEYYKEILNNESSSAEAKANAEAQIKEIAAGMTLEVNMEGLIKSKGFSEVLVNYSSSYINVIVQSSELTEAEVAQIVEVIQSQVDRDIDYIKIIPVE